MEMTIILVIFVKLILHFAFPLFLVRVVLGNTTWLNPIYLKSIFSFPVLFFTLTAGPLYLIDKPYSNPHFLNILLMDTYSLIGSTFTQCIICIALNKLFSRSLSNVSEKSTGISSENLKIVGWTFAAISIICFVVLSSKTTGIIQWIINPRYGYQFQRSGQGHLYVPMLTFMAIASVLLAFSESKYRYWLLAFPLGLFISYVAGSKALLLNFALWIVIAMKFRGVKISAWQVATVMSVGFAGMLFNFYLSGAASIRDLYAYFDYYPNSVSIIQKFENGTAHFFNGQIFISSFWEGVPRSFFPEKPRVYGILHLNELLWPGLAAEGHTPAFGGPMLLYGDFGWTGVLFGSFGWIGDVFQGAVVFFGIKAFEKGRGQKISILGLLGFILIAGPSIFYLLPFSLFMPATLLLGLFILSISKIRLKNEA